jgi:hypothetical protein
VVAVLTLSFLRACMQDLQSPGCVGVLDALRTAFTAVGRWRLRLAVLDHVVSFPPVVLPVAAMAEACKQVDTRGQVAAGLEAAGRCKDSAEGLELAIRLGWACGMRRVTCERQAQGASAARLASCTRDWLYCRYTFRTCPAEETNGMMMSGGGSVRPNAESS